MLRFTFYYQKLLFFSNIKKVGPNKNEQKSTQNCNCKYEYQSFFNKLLLLYLLPCDVVVSVDAVDDVVVELVQPLEQVQLLLDLVQLGLLRVGEAKKVLA